MNISIKGKIMTRLRLKIALLGLVMAFCLIFTNFLNVEASSNDESISDTLFNLSENTDKMSESEINVKLKELGFPERLISTMSSAEKEYNAIEGKKFAGAINIKYDINGNVIAEDDYSSSASIMMPFGTIVNMDVTQYATQIGTVSGRERYTLTAKYDWGILPKWRLTDLVGFAWNGNLVNSVPNTSYIVAGGNGWNGSYSYSSHSLYSSSFTGAGWSFPMPTSGSHIVAAVRIDIEEKRSVSQKSQFHTLYTHTYGTTGSIGLNFGILSVTYNGSMSSDQRATISDIYY